MRFECGGKLLDWIRAWRITATMYRAPIDGPTNLETRPHDMNIVKQMINRVESQLAEFQADKTRDFVLDFSKGIAIILVVLGHTFQGQAENFDDVYGFRIIYSFHMPLFALLAGAAASHWIAKFNVTSSFRELARSSIDRIRRSALHLLLPFFSWTVIAFWVGNSKESLPEYLLEVFKQADRSLWFLPCIF